MARRRKTPAQIESQSRRLTLENFMRGDDRSRSQRIYRATNSVRRQNGYFNTGYRTRNMDEIFQRDNSNRRFTVQQGREVPYRGNRAPNANENNRVSRRTATEQGLNAK